MSVRRTLLGSALVAIAIALPVALRAQHGSAPPALNTTAAKESQQFAFHIGQWELEAKPGATT